MSRVIPIAPLPRRRRRRLTGFVVVVLVCDALAAYKVGILDRRPPHFSLGGVFEVPGHGPPPSLPDGPFSVFGKPGPPTTQATSHTTAGNDRSSLSNPSRGVGTAAGRAGGASKSNGTSGFAPSGSSPGETSPVTTEPPSASGTPPALGTYTWNVKGSETATGFGSRNFPSQMTMIAHRGTSDPGEVVLDLTYSSDHQEREILGCRDGGIFFDYEAGQVRFGPMAQSNQGSYSPPLLEIPVPLAAGRTFNGTTKVIAGDGSTERTEAWTVTVDGPATLQIAGHPVNTWQVTTERHSLPGSSQTDNRTETYWYDPARHFWVQFAVKQHGQQSFSGFTFTYDEQLVATLNSFEGS